MLVIVQLSNTLDVMELYPNEAPDGGFPIQHKENVLLDVNAQETDCYGRQPTVTIDETKDKITII